jgi:ATP-dependent exoDNAse (exonuclease V) beta subunit
VELLLVPEGRADAQRQAEAEAIAQRITALATPPAEAPPGWRPPRMDEIALLVPSWSHLEPLKRALQARRIPYIVRGGPGFWDRREVDDLVVLLRWVSDPSDRLSLAALLRGPLVGLSDAGLGNLFARSSGLEHILDPPAALRAALDPEDRARLDEARPALRRLVRFGSTLGPDGVLRQCLAERNYCAVLARLPFGAQRVANVDKLVGMATAAARRGGEDGDLAGFVAWLDRTRETSRRESEADLDDAATGSVHLLSIHAAKGLEWPVVFVAQTSRRGVSRAERVLLDAERRLVVLPGGAAPPETFRALRRDAFAAEEDDGRRLLYVALTRARDLLVVSGPEEDGEGPWGALRGALQREAPHRVRVLRADGAPPAVPVRAHREDQGALEEAPEPEARPAPRRRLALASEALQDYALCARRYHTLFELRLAERGLLGADQDAAGALARRALHEAPLEGLLRDPGGALEALCRARGEGPPPAVRQAARTLLERFVDSAPGVCLLRTPEALLGRALPFSVKVTEGDREVLVTGRADLVLRAQGLGREGVVTLRLAMPPERDDRWEAMPEAELGLELARLALASRYREALGEDVPVHAAVLALGAPGPLEWVQRREPLEGRVLDLAEALSQSHAEARWSSRPRYVCEGLRCGFIPRCHG